MQPFIERVYWIKDNYALLEKFGNLTSLEVEPPRLNNSSIMDVIDLMETNFVERLKSSKYKLNNKETQRDSGIRRPQ